MKNISLWSIAERHAVEDKYIDNVAFAAFKGPCYSISSFQKFFSLHPSELFYQCFYLIDTIKAKGIMEAQQYCRTTVSGELLTYLQEKTGIDNVPGYDLIKGQILLSVALLLECSGDGKYVPLITILTNEAVSKVDNETSELLEKYYCNCKKFYDMNALKDYAKSYVKSEVFISEEIEDMLDELPTPDIQETVTIAGNKVYLAKGKITAMVVLLNKVYEKGWLVDVEGNRLTNRDNAIKEIMKNAFGEENVAPAQLLNQAKKRNKTMEENDYIKELL